MILIDEGHDCHTAGMLDYLPRPEAAVAANLVYTKNPKPAGLKQRNSFGFTT
jgi:hypothetical protein